MPRLRRDWDRELPHASVVALPGGATTDGYRRPKNQPKMRLLAPWSHRPFAAKSLLAATNRGLLVYMLRLRRGSAGRSPTEAGGRAIRCY